MKPMTKAAEALLHEAQTLSAEERAMVAEKLLETLDPETDVDVETAWAAEVESRADEVASDRSVLIDWYDAKAQIERDLRKR